MQTSTYENRNLSKQKPEYRCVFLMLGLVCKERRFATTPPAIELASATALRAFKVSAKAANANNSIM